MAKSIYAISEDKDTFLKRYEKVALSRFFFLFLSAFMLMFILLSTLYYFQESSRLSKELEVINSMNYIECMKLKMEECSQYQKIEPNLDELFKNIFFALLWVLLLFVPISLFLAIFALKPVRQASTMIDNFIANIVHDINTPIASIMLNAKSIIRKSSEKSKKLTRILSSAKQLIDMQHDLLALADENTSIEKTSLDLKPLAEEIIEAFQLQHPSQFFEIKLSPQTIVVNQVDCRRIIQNLISNAVKYNRDENLIKIYSQKELFIIEDQGKGMAHSEKVFEKNYREDYTIQGNGLGLASVMAMLQRNNIEITVKSKLNRGTQISLNFH